MCVALLVMTANYRASIHCAASRHSVLRCSGLKNPMCPIRLTPASRGVTVTPADTGVSRIGHMGFFRPEHRYTLWRGAAEWIEAEE